MKSFPSWLTFNERQVKGSSPLEILTKSNVLVDFQWGSSHGIKIWWLEILTKNNVRNGKSQHSQPYDVLKNYKKPPQNYNVKMLMGTNFLRTLFYNYKYIVFLKNESQHVKHIVWCNRLSFFPDNELSHDGSVILHLSS